MRRHASQDGDVTRVVVRDGYHPASIVARSGRPLTLAFDREESRPCSRTLVVPALGRLVELPEGQVTLVRCGSLAAGDYEFHCGDGLLRGVVHVR